MIFQRAIRRELLNTVGAVFTILFTIVMTVILIRILGDAAAGKIAPTDVAAMLGFASLGYLPVIISLTAFIAVLMVVSRSYQDSEMVVWLASGLSLRQWVGPVLGVGMPMVVITAVLSIWLTPWANRSSAEYKERFQKREDVARVSPGKFQESASGDKMFFVEGVANDLSKVRNIFVREAGQRDSVVSAEEGAIGFSDRGEKTLQLFQGRRYEGAPGTQEIRVVEFERYSLLLSQNERDFGNTTTARALSTVQLIEQPTPPNLSELMWRISIPVMCLLQIFLAIPLGFVNPRRGRALNLSIALLLAITYSNMVGVLQGSIATGRMSLATAYGTLHLSVFLLSLLLLYWRDNTNSRWHPARLLGSIRHLIASPGGASA
ncbi:MAG: LPS export ABC transporter permease LptF [Oxalobacteraceae bacterium]|jgi:lipopolysaccharide export system permease protein|nr:LPS export ABC transporter permease LptF [Oxalobacteraceae bacterium]